MKNPDDVKKSIILLSSRTGLIGLIAWAVFPGFNTFRGLSESELSDAADTIRAVVLVLRRGPFSVRLSKLIASELGCRYLTYPVLVKNITALLSGFKTYYEFSQMMLVLERHRRLATANFI